MIRKPYFRLNSFIFGAVAESSVDAGLIFPANKNDDGKNKKEMWMVEKSSGAWCNNKVRAPPAQQIYKAGRGRGPLFFRRRTQKCRINKDFLFVTKIYKKYVKNKMTEEN